MTPNSGRPPEAPTVPLEPVGGAKRPAQVGENSYASIHTGSILVGRYRLTDQLGEGGMSRVYKALDELSAIPGDDPVPSLIAIKVLSQDFTDPAGRFAALTAQVNRLRRLSHPNIVRLFGCERDASIAFITMEYLPGESAYVRLHPRAVGSAVPLEAHAARYIVTLVANALVYAHDQGVVHGDLKPGNLMVSPEFGAKVIDFGMTRWRARLGAVELLAPIPLAATAPYASPQLMAGAEPHPSDDVFSLACVAYELITGVHPFDGESTGQTFKSAPPHRPGLAPAEYAALLHALQPERDQRTHSVRDFMAEFATSSPRSSKTVRPLFWGVAAAAFVAAVAAILIVINQRNETVPPPQIAPSVQSAAPSVQQPAPPAAVPSVPVPVKAGTVIQDCATCPEITVLPPGEFQQGAPPEDRDASPLERPQHAVQINNLLGFSTADITVDDFRHFVEATSREMKGCDTYDGDWRHRNSANWQDPGFMQTSRHPVVCVSFNDAIAYADWLSTTTGHKYRLPSASEWEYAARANSSESRPWKLDRAGACATANIADRSAERRYPGWQVFPCDDGYVYTAPVGSFKSNGFSLSDVLGNVLVWTQDCWVPDYNGAPSDGSPRKTAVCSEHEVRGGSWFSPPGVVKVSYRNHFESDYRTSSIGVRLVREIG